MIVKTIKNYFDRETGELYTTESNLEREVSKERGLGLIEKGVAIEVKKKTKTVEDEVAEDEKAEDNKEVVEDNKVETEEKVEETESKPNNKRTPKTK